MIERQSSDQVAEWVYRDSFYPVAYRKVVANSFAKKSQYRQIAHLLPQCDHTQTVTILEIGPSNVPLLKYAIQEIGLPIDCFKLIGLDKFPRMHPPAFEMLTASVTEIPLQDCSVDVVVMSSVLFFVSHQQRAINECARVLIPGGQLILCEPDIDQATNLSRLVLAYEVDAIRAETLNQTPGWVGSMIYRYRVFKSMVLRLPYLLPALSINKHIHFLRKGHEGFTESHLMNFLTEADLTLATKGRTYADAYFLLVGQKNSSAMSGNSATL